MSGGRGAASRREARFEVQVRCPRRVRLVAEVGSRSSDMPVAGGANTYEFLEDDLIVQFDPFHMKTKQPGAQAFLP